MDKKEFIKKIDVNGREYCIADITLLEKKGIADIKGFRFQLKFWLKTC